MEKRLKNIVSSKMFAALYGIVLKAFVNSNVLHHYPGEKVYTSTSIPASFIFDFWFPRN